MTMEYSIIIRTIGIKCLIKTKGMHIVRNWKSVLKKLNSWFNNNNKTMYPNKCLLNFRNYTQEDKLKQVYNFNNTMTVFTIPKN